MTEAKNLSPARLFRAYQDLNKGTMERRVDAWDRLSNHDRQLIRKMVEDDDREAIG